MPQDDEPLSFWQVLFSVLAAAFGVQSDKARQRDFRRGTPGQFVAVGLIATTFLVLLLIGAAKLVLSLAGAN